MKKRLLFLLLFVVGVGATIGATQLNENTVSSKEVTVLICNSKTAYAYHDHKCSGLKRCKSSIVKMRQTEATKLGRRPCKICYK